MTRWRYSLLAVLAVMTCSIDAGAQTRSVPRFQPRRPKFSAAMNYFRQDVGLLDQFNLFQQRDLRLEQTFGQQQRQIDLQRRSLDQAGQDLGQLGDALNQRFRPTAATPTGKGATFRSYARYFNTRSSRR